MAGWISIHRKIRNHWLWEEKPFDRRSAWIDLILSANYREATILLGNDLIRVERGSFITSELKLSKKWGWSRTKVRNFLILLEKDNMLLRETDNKKTSLTIVNYKDYQIGETSKEQGENREKTGKEHGKSTNNKENKDNKNNKENKKYIGGNDGANSHYNKKVRREADRLKEIAIKEGLIGEDGRVQDIGEIDF